MTPFCRFLIRGRDRSFLCTVAALATLAAITFAEAAPRRIPVAKLNLGQTPRIPVADPEDPQPGRNQRPSVFYSNPGPWGRLRCFYIYLEAPQSLVNEMPMPNTKPRWTLPASTASQLPQYFKDVGLSDSFRAALLDPKNQTVEGNVLHLFPPVPELENMPPRARELIYGELRKYQDNEFHYEPVRITTPTVEEFYATSKLSPDFIAKIAKMAYRYGDCLAFSDLPALLSHAQSESEVRAIFKGLTRTRSLMAHLELPDGTDLKPLIDYWTTRQPPRLKDVEPLMQSIADTHGAERLGLAHLLPAQARKLLYTNPSLEFAREGIQPDCHWTSLNFFNFTSQNYLLSEKLAASSVLQKYAPVKTANQFGDILFFMNRETGGAQHSCVYVADGLVFTKNGRNALQPWLLMKLDDLKKMYLHGPVDRILAYRQKDATN